MEIIFKGKGSLLQLTTGVILGCAISFVNWKFSHLTYNILFVLFLFTLPVLFSWKSCVIITMIWIVNYPFIDKWHYFLYLVYFGAMTVLQFYSNKLYGRDVRLIASAEFYWGLSNGKVEVTRLDVISALIRVAVYIAFFVSTYDNLLFL